MPTQSPDLLLAAPAVRDLKLLDHDIDKLGAAARNRDRSTTLNLLIDLVPEYKAPSTKT
jgi:hypothetical protein